MTHQEHVNLIKKAITEKGGTWADFGSGEGAFTLALRDLTETGVEIYSIDVDNQRLENQKKQFDTQFPNTNIHYLQSDFTKNLELPRLDGIIMANSLHYIKDQTNFLRSLQIYLKPNGTFVLVEYSLDVKNPPWVPYPLSYPTFEKLAKGVGFKKVELLKKIPSSYWKEMYSAVAKLS